MEKCSSFLFLILFTSLVVFCKSQDTLCSVCSVGVCRNPIEVERFACRLLNPKDVKISPNITWPYEKLKEIAFYDIETLTLESRSFMKNPNISVIIENVKKVDAAEKSLANVGTLSITKVDYLDLKTSSLDIRIREITIKDSFISDLHKGVFYDLRGLKKIHFSNTTIHNIGTGTVALMNLDQLVAEHSNFNGVSNNAVMIGSKTISVNDIKFYGHPASVTFTASTIEIENSEFICRDDTAPAFARSACSDSSELPVLTAHQIKIKNNYFSQLSISVYNKITRNKNSVIHFERNKIEKIDLNDTITTGDNSIKNIKNNAIFCQYDNSLPDGLNGAFGVDKYMVFRDNYCVSCSPCCTLTLEEFVNNKECSSVHKNNDYLCDICKDMGMEKTSGSCNLNSVSFYFISIFLILFNIQRF